VLALLVGAFAGGLIAAAGGARRISSAYDRFSTATRAADVGVVPRCPQIPDEPCGAAADLPKLDGLAAVDALALGYSWAAPITTTDGTLLNPAGDSCFSGSGELSVLAPLDTGLNEVLLVAGRQPRPDRADEVMLALPTAERAGVRAGDEVLLYLHAGDCNDESTWGSPTRVRVVGIGQMAGEVPALVGSGSNAYTSLLR
jgi:hypothetical protein